MAGKSFDVSGMIRALEGFLESTAPAPPPAPPRAKTELESRLEKLVEELSRPPEPPASPPSVDVQIPAELDELPVPQPEPEVVAVEEDLVPPTPIRDEDEVPAAPKAPPMPSRPASSRGWLGKLGLSAALALAVSVVVGVLKKPRPSPVAPRPEPRAVASAPSPAPASMSAAPLDPRAKALALILAYRPSGGPVTCGEIFRSIAGNPLPAGDWDLQDLGSGRFSARFSPYSGALAETYSYRFAVDARAGRVRPEADTAERLRADALGRLAARSDLQAFWQFLDLGR